MPGGIIQKDVDVEEDALSVALPRRGWLTRWETSRTDFSKTLVENGRIGSVPWRNGIYLVGVIRFRSATSEDRACISLDHFIATDGAFDQKRPSDYVVVFSIRSCSYVSTHMTLGKRISASDNDSLCDVLMASVTSWLLYLLVCVEKEYTANDKYALDAFRKPLQSISSAPGMSRWDAQYKNTNAQFDTKEVHYFFRKYRRSSRDRWWSSFMVVWPNMW